MLLSLGSSQPPGPPSSWNDGKAKQAPLDFVGKVTQEDGSNFVPPECRIATFGDDDTLRAEQPSSMSLPAAAYEDERSPSRILVTVTVLNAVAVRASFPRHADREYPGRSSADAIA